MNKLMLLIKVSRPLFWFALPLSFLLGLSSSGAELSLLPLMQAFLLSFPFCVLVYGINDIYDYESDKVNPRKKLIYGIKLAPEYRSFVKTSAIFVVILLILSSLLTLNVSNIFAMFVLVFFAYFYSAPPLRLKEKPPFDSFVNGMGYFFLPFILGYSFGNSVFSISIDTYLISAYIMGIHVFSTITDYTVDKRIGHKTFAVTFGKRLSAISAFLIFALTLRFYKFEPLTIHQYFALLSSLIIAIFPSEKLATKFFMLMVLGLILAAILHLIYLPFHPLIINLSRL